jgi:hypothetical protein
MAMVRERPAAQHSGTRSIAGGPAGAGARYEKQARRTAETDHVTVWMARRDPRRFWCQGMSTRTSGPGGDR